MASDEAKARAYAFEPITVTVDRGRLAFFARATGQADPVCTDLAEVKLAVTLADGTVTLTGDAVIDLN